MSLPKINHTQISNAFIDGWMHRLDSDCHSVFIAIARKTIGWHKETDWIVQSQMSEITGLAIKRVRQAVRVLEENHLIEISRKGSGRGQKWSYSIDYDVVDNGAETDSISELIGAVSAPLSTDIGAETAPISQFNGAETAPTKERDINKKENKEKESADFSAAVVGLKDLYDPFWIEAKSLGLILPDSKESAIRFFPFIKTLMKYKREHIADGLKFAMRWLRYCIRKKRISPSLNERQKWIVGEIKYSLDYIRDRGLDATEELAKFAINNDFWSGALFSLKNLYKAESKRQQETT